jgi:hypothetical protein
MAAHLKAVPRPPAEKYKSTLRSDLVALIVQALTLPSLIGAVLMLNGSGSGQYWIAAGVIIPFLVVFYTSWVLLIEILR